MSRLGNRLKKPAKPLPTSYEELVRMYAPRALHDEADYANAQEIIDALATLPKPTADQKAYLETLAVLFEAYEREHHAIDTSDLTPREVLAYLMEENALNVSDVGRVMGSQSAASMFLNGSRKELSKTQIRALAKHFNLDPGVFL